MWPDLSEKDWFYLDVMEATHSHTADFEHFKYESEYWVR
jgi:hypothetical protein